MTRRELVAALSAATLAPLPNSSAHAQEKWPLTPDSERQDGVPQGKVTQHSFKTSKLFPGTERDYWVYVPAQYDGSAPACVMVFQDGGGFQDNGGGFRAPIVLDNLIHKKEMPVTIGVFVNPGVVPPSDPATQLPRYNRSYEYDALSDVYARFLMEELLPEIGKQYQLTNDAIGRAVCGASSGGICSFTVAWEHPEWFSRVVSFIGSFTDLRGGNIYPDLIRKREAKPIKVFLQDGSNDQDIYSGSWFIGNNDVAAALKFAGYEYQYVVGDGGHDGRHGRAILPDALRWVWKDYPEPLRAAPNGSRQPVVGFVAPETRWIDARVEQADGPLATDTQENLYFVAANGKFLFQRQPDETVVGVKNNADIRCLAVGPGDRVYAGLSKGRRIVMYDAAWKEVVLAPGIEASALTVTHTGVVYAIEARTGKILRIAKDGKKTEVGMSTPGSQLLQLTPDQSLLMTADTEGFGKFIASYRILPNGSLGDMQRYHDLYVPYGEDRAHACASAVDTNGWLYVATSGGIQVLDQAGRVNGIISNPERKIPTGMAFGGPDRAYLYVTSGGPTGKRQVFRRQTKGTAVFSGEAPIKPPGPRL